MKSNKKNDKLVHKLQMSEKLFVSCYAFNIGKQFVSGYSVNTEKQFVSLS